MQGRNCSLFGPVMLIVVIAILAFCARPSSGQEPTNRKPYDSLTELRSGSGQGTATLIAVKPGTDLGVTLTARHVAQKPYKEMKANWIWAQAGRTDAMTYAVVKGDKFASDMALVVCRVPRGIEPIQVVPFDPAAGPWTAAGYRDGLLRVAGPFNQVRHTTDGKIIVDGPFIAGMSGGFMCDRFGRVVGVVVASDEKTVGVCSDGEYLQNLLKTEVPGYAP